MAFKSYIKVPREFFRSEEWTASRKFSRFEAMIDLLESAAYADGFTIYCASRDVVLKRGQLLTSQRDLAEKWGWSPATVNRYLQTLRNTRRNSIRIKIETTIETNRTLVTICNYDEWDLEISTDETPSETACETPSGTTYETYIELNSRIKENKERIHTQVFSEKGGVGGNNAGPSSDATCVEARRMVEWIAENVPTVAGMQTPITEQSAVWMMRKYSVEDIHRIILAMHNKRAYKNVDAYVTFGNFARRDLQLNGGKTDMAAGPKPYTYEEVCDFVAARRGTTYDFERQVVGGRPVWFRKSDLPANQPPQQ